MARFRTERWFVRKERKLAEETARLLFVPRPGDRLRHRQMHGVVASVTEIGCGGEIYARVNGYDFDRRIDFQDWEPA